MGDRLDLSHLARIGFDGIFVVTFKWGQGPEKKATFYNLQVILLALP